MIVDLLKWVDCGLIQLLSGFKGSLLLKNGSYVFFFFFALKFSLVSKLVLVTIFRISSEKLFLVTIFLIHL